MESSRYRAAWECNPKTQENSAESPECQWPSQLGAVSLKKVPGLGKGPLKSPALLCLVAQSCPTRCDPMDCSLSGSSDHRDSPGKNTAVGCHDLLQGILPTQGLNPSLPHCRWILYCLSHHGPAIICSSDSSSLPHFSPCPSPFSVLLDLVLQCFQASCLPPPVNGKRAVTQKAVPHSLLA